MITCLTGIADGAPRGRRKNKVTQNTFIFIFIADGLLHADEKIKVDCQTEHYDFCSSGVHHDFTQPIKMDSVEKFLTDNDLREYVERFKGKILHVVITHVGIHVI